MRANAYGKLIHMITRIAYEKDVFTMNLGRRSTG